MQAAILKLLHGLRSELGLSCLLITCDIEVVRLMYERVIIMRHGRIVESGNMHTVLAAPQTRYGRELMAAVARFPARRVQQGASTS